MTTMTSTRPLVTGGVDTHRDEHVAAALDRVGGLLGTASFPTSTAGYAALLAWLRTYGEVSSVGVEGTGSYGAGLARHLTSNKLVVLAISRPNRQVRRRYGKSDVVDAIAAGQAVLSGEATGTPKTHDGPVEALRALKSLHRSANKARTQAINQIRATLVTAPDELRARLRDLSRRDLLATCAAFRIGADDDSLAGIIRLTLRELASRVAFLDAQIKSTVVRLKRITDELAPDLVAMHGVGPDTASTLLLTAGDNPDRLRSERSFASLTGSCPVPATSGLIQKRYRLNRGGAGKPTPLSGASRWSGLVPTRPPASTSHDARPRARPRSKRCAASSATSPARSTTPYRKQPSVDSRSIAHVEQKNWSVVRQAVGYHRYDTAAELALLNEVYALLRLLINFFSPQQKLIDKRREGAKVIKRYDTAQTPYQRVLADPRVTRKVKQALTAQYRQLNRGAATPRPTGPQRAAPDTGQGQAPAQPAARSSTGSDTSICTGASGGVVSSRSRQGSIDAAVRCYYANDPASRPLCTLTAVVMFGTVALCPTCPPQRSSVGKGTPPAPLPAGPELQVLDWVGAAHQQAAAAERTLAAAVARARQTG